MKYICKVNIDLPMDEVVQLWSDKSYYSEWQDDFKSMTLLSGKEGAVGAKSEIIFDGKQKIELIETILVNELPYKKEALYEHVHMINTQTTKFESLGSDQTQFTSEVEYTQFNTWFIKLFAKLFPGKFKAQSQKWMEQFKTFAEQKK